MKDDWTEQVRQDLVDLGNKEDLEWIKTTSLYTFRKLVCAIYIKLCNFFGDIDEQNAGVICETRSINYL